jgi:hypothetical protein
MPWYKFHADHGPGHQSHSIYYRFYIEPLNREEKSYEWDEFFKDRDWPIGGVKLIRKVPDIILQKKIQSLKREIKDARAMLKALSR